MGAWGHGSFDNDSAMDWLAEVEDGGADAVAAAFDLSDDYIDADEASACLAAAELVAAAHDGDMEHLHEAFKEAFAQHKTEIAELDRADAHAAVERVFKKSELRELWDENGEDTDWHKDVKQLLARLV